MWKRPYNFPLPAKQEGTSDKAGSQPRFHRTSRSLQRSGLTSTGHLLYAGPRGGQQTQASSFNLLILQADISVSSLYRSGHGFSEAWCTGSPAAGHGARHGHFPRCYPVTSAGQLCPLYRLFSLLAASLSWAASCSPCWSRVSAQFPSVKAVYCPLHPFFLSLLSDWVLSLQ